MSKVVKSTESLSPETPDRNTIVKAGQVLSNLKFKRVSPPSFNSIPEFVGLDYVGYIIDKERLDTKTGHWIRIDEYKILGTQAANFKDSRLAYGGQYRYKIKSVMKVTLPVIKESRTNLDLQQDLRTFEKDLIVERLKSMKGTLANLDRVTNQGLVGKVSSGQRITTLEVIQGLQVRSTDNRLTSVQVPVQSQKEAVSLSGRMKNLKSQNFELSKGVISRVKLQKEINTALKNFKETSIEYKSYYYESECSKNWVYVSVIENEPPPPPTAIKIIPNTLQKKISITWLKPTNSQRDIKFFKIYKKNSVQDSWRLLTEKTEIDIDGEGAEDPNAKHELAQIPNDINVLEDFNMEIGNDGRPTDKKYIYAISCVDAHGIESFLSIQTEAQLNPNYESEGKEKPLKWISGSGARPDEKGVVFKKFLDQEESIVAKNNITLAPTKEFADTEKNLVVRITSLDTHETKEIKVVLKNINVRDIYREENIFV
jgi:hypothetical protein